LDAAAAAEDTEIQPNFAITCHLASMLTGKDQPGGKLIAFEGGCAIVENHAVANVDVLFHEEGEDCSSHH
jgi:hypothetical protein